MHVAKQCRKLGGGNGVVGHEGRHDVGSQFEGGELVGLEGPNAAVREGLGLGAVIYEKRAGNYLTMLHIDAIIIWL